MYSKIVRTVAASFLVISTSVGVTNTQVKIVPAVLDAKITSIEHDAGSSSAQPRIASPEATVAAVTLSMVSTISPTTFAPEAGPSAQVVQPTTPSPITEAEQAIKEAQKVKELRVLKLQAYLEKNNSPMANNAQDFIDAAEQYETDWRLVPAIAGVESTFGKNVLQDSFNPFGWGGGYIRFSSWREAIYTVTKGISEKYIKDGLDTPLKMQPRYAPPSHTWGHKVEYFMDKIEDYEVITEDDK